jgi:hypothetical protein
LGTVIHRVIDDLAKLSKEVRFLISLKQRFEARWSFYQGKKGGFLSKEEEENFKSRGFKMIEKLENSVIIKGENYRKEEKLPKVRLFKNENLILVGSIDWIEILPNKTLHIIDFKTGKTEEEENSLQLPIYFILAYYNLKKPIEKVSYWYLDREEEPISVNLKPIQVYISILRQKALEIKEAIEKDKLICKSSKKYCKCKKYEAILENKGEYVGYDPEMKRDLFFVLAN